ncbi:MAG: phosphate acyltransferase PlsX [Christensenellales bacterium]
MRIVIDAFGGDHAPSEIIKGCIQSLQTVDAALILVGDEGIIQKELAQYDYDRSRIEVRHAGDIISMEDSPVEAITKKTDSSMVVALKAVADQEADAVVSAGNTGALLAGATIIIKRLKGIRRPALAPLLPTLGSWMLLIDCGANVECKPVHLQQFGIMGSIYMQSIYHIEPRVALLNNGTEEEKGNNLTLEAHKLLKQAPIRFVGNVEARDILSGKYDVLVTDGFVGNVVLKYTEGFAGTIMSMIKEEVMRGFITKLGGLLLKPAFKRVKRRMDYTEQGGAPLLGINGIVIKAHGSSDAKAIASAIRQAARAVEYKINDQIKEKIAAVDLPDDV